VKRVADGARRVGSLRGQLLRWLLLPLAALVIIDVVNVYHGALDAADLAYDRTLLASSRAIAERILVVDGQIKVDVPYVALDIFEADTPGRIYYKVTGPNGEFISGYDDFPPVPPGVRRSDMYPALVSFRHGQYHDQPLRIATLLQPVFEGGVRGMVEIQIGETLDARRVLTRKILVETLWREIALVLAVALLAWIAVRVALRPLLRLAADVEQRQPTDLSEFEPGRVHTEVRPLVAAINHYTSRLQRLLGAHRRFIADAAHQLRTPLAVLKTQSEVALRETEPGAIREVVAAQRATIDRTVELANQLLALARAEQGIVAQRFEAIDAAELVKRLCLDLAPEAVHRGIELGFESATPAHVVGDPVLLRELVSNLVGNALQYTPDGGRVTVRVEGDDAGATVEVEDTGPGIPAAEREKVFEPFYRIPGTPGAGGPSRSGLGLAIAREIAGAHGASIELADAPGHGLRVVVRFVRSQPGHPEPPAA
jgi:two-component system, OmpR family, sensor histidine kinase TctE